MTCLSSLSPLPPFLSLPSTKFSAYKLIFDFLSITPSVPLLLPQTVNPDSNPTTTTSTSRMKRAAQRRRTQHQQPRPPTPQFSTPQFPTYQHHHRDSDASLASSRPSSSFNPHPHPHNADNKHASLRSVNAYLSKHSFPITLSLKPLPSAKDLTDILNFLLSQLGFALNPSHKLEDDLFVLLKFLNCPHKVNKSAFRAPGAPHSFPLILSVIHWLVQLADFADFRRSDHNSDSNWLARDSIMAYALDSYLAYMNGDDDGVELLDNQLAEKMENESGLLAEKLNSMEEEGKKLEVELNALKSRPSEKETFQEQRKDLEADLEKLQVFVASVQDKHSDAVRALEDKETKLAAKLAEIRQIREENEELKNRVKSQGINMRDAERMKRELLALERDTSEAESSRSSWEEKCWELDSSNGKILKELESLSMKCNDALRRIKLGGDFQYVLNAKGSSPAKVLGINYKSTLKPAINAFADEIKKSTTAKWEEFIALQERSKEMTAMIEAERNRISMKQSHIDDMGRQLEMIRNEINAFASKCASEAEKIAGDVEAEVHNLDVMESQALDASKAAKLKLQQETKQSEEETQRCAYELFALIDSVSKYKEHVEKKISEMRNGLSETTEFISGAYKSTLLGQLYI